VTFSSRLKGDAVFNRSIEFGFMLHRFPSRISNSGQEHQVRCVAFRSLFVKISNHGAIVGHFCSGVSFGLYRHAGCGSDIGGLSLLQGILSLRSATTVSNSNIPPSSPTTTHLELTSALMRSYVAFIKTRHNHPKLSQ
jgi:hypothetical protein